MKELRLSEIWIYPVKSLGGIRLNSAKVFEKGLQFDRRWMLVDENGLFMTQRTNPRMALFKLAINGNTFIITFAQTPSASVELPAIRLNAGTHARGEVLDARIWNDEVAVAETDPAISEWFSHRLQIKCRLVSFPEENPRAVDPEFSVNGENVSLADAYPFLLIGQSSLDDLNSKLAEPLPMNRFRPNFVFTGGKPYEEDTWSTVRIGGNRFAAVKQCARCALPTVNQDTAEKGIEPLYTLSTYRKNGNKVLFGQNLIAIDHAIVTEGDPVMAE
jgi:uncharacterized protein